MHTNNCEINEQTNCDIGCKTIVIWFEIKSKLIQKCKVKMRIDIGIIITGLFLFNVNGCPSSKSDQKGKVQIL